MKFKIKYEDKKYPSANSLALEIGSIAHKGKELVAEALVRGEQPDYYYIKNIVENGYEDKENKRNPHITGVKELKEKYFSDWQTADEKSGLSYEEKLEIYFNGLFDTEQDKEWKPILVEAKFNFMFRDKYNFSGFIDKVDQNSLGDLRIVDYKSSKQLFEDKDIKTPMQMVIYDFGVEVNMGKLPIKHLYDFIFLGKTQPACSKGYLKRGETKLNKLFDRLENCRSTGLYEPKPTPLCHWCDFCKTNSNAVEQYKYECPYHSLWVPNNKTFEVAQKFNGMTATKTKDFWF